MTIIQNVKKLNEQDKRTLVKIDNQIVQSIEFVLEEFNV